MQISYFSQPIRESGMATVVTTDMLSETPGHAPRICAATGQREDVAESTAVIPLSSPVVISVGEREVANLPVGSVGILTQGNGHAGTEGTEHLLIPMPHSRMGTCAAFDDGMNRVRGDAAIAYRPMIESEDDYSLGKLSLRNEYPYRAAATDCVITYVLMRGQAMAVAWRPGNEDALPLLLSAMAAGKITALDLLNDAGSKPGDTLQDGLSRALRAEANELAYSPVIGADDSAWLFAHPLMARTAITVYPGEMVFLVNVSHWSTPEFLVLTSS